MTCKIKWRPQKTKKQNEQKFLRKKIFFINVIENKTYVHKHTYVHIYVYTFYDSNNTILMPPTPPVNHKK